ncbi:MAG: transposase [bacterium]|nr:transposase [bacterium]
MEVSLCGRKDLSILRERVRKESNAKQRDRYRAVVLALEGRSEPEIRLRLGRSRGFIQRWVYAYRDQGINGLKAKKPHGQPPKLPRNREAELKALLGQPGAPRRGRDVAALLQEHFGVTYSVRGALVLLHRLGYGPLKPRPVNPKKDPSAEAQWLQASPFLSNPSRHNTPTSPSKCGSRTKAASDRKDA